MTSSVFYRVAAVLLVLYAAGHTYGFRQPAEFPGPSKEVADQMKSVRFPTQGFMRSFWDFYVGFGLHITVLLLFAALLAWQLGGLTAPALAAQPWAMTWGFAICFAVSTVMTWRYFFVAPGVFSTLITLCLIAGAARAR
jgi:hypothetical protein